MDTRTPTVTLSTTSVARALIAGRVLTTTDGTLYTGPRAGFGVVAPLGTADADAIHALIADEHATFSQDTLDEHGAADVIPTAETSARVQAWLDAAAEPAARADAAPDYCPGIEAGGACYCED